MSVDVEEHRKGIILSGNLSDFQLTNLKTWPHVLFDGIINSRVSYNFSSVSVNSPSHTNCGSVDYDIKLKNKVKEEDRKKIAQQLNLWVKFLFWKETSVSLRVDGEKWKM